jgi:GntR family transcriptional repressor for pyruvate dehydrogenase complex
MRAAILGGQLRPGDRLPSESELATSFGVSRSVVREALKVLASSGLVTSVRGRDGGTFVVHVAGDAAAQSLAETLHLMLDLERINLTEVVEARRMVESACARLAAERRTGDDLEAMVRVLEQASRDISDQEWLDLDVAFHNAEAAAAHNRV